jgi:hypothetical protein
MLEFPELDARILSLHSPRIGGATDAFRNNVPCHVIDVKGRWKAHSSKFTYLRVSEKELVESMKQSSSYF